MAFTPYHNIVGATARDNELVATGDLPRSGIKSIQLTNIHGSAAATIDLYLYKDSTDTTSDETYYFLKDYQIAHRGYLILDNIHLLNFDNSTYSLHIETGSSDTVDVMIRK
tara:strand:+ start:1086 stop:1418 length:333 start_codon:yes stop_codon:yes gene_type:complete